jgi:hypothetical protein
MKEKITMGNENNAIALDILNSLSEYIKQNGVEATIAHLNTAPKELTDNYPKRVLHEVAYAFGMSTDTLLNAKYIRGDQKYAIGFCVHYLYPILSITEISKTIFNQRDKAVLSRYKSIIEKLNPKHKADKDYLKIKQELDLILNK